MMHFTDAAGWESWLEAHHRDTGEAWLKIAKKGSGAVSVTAGQALEAALCHGWIDSTRRACDERFFLQRYSPRRRGGPWSRVNVERAQALIAAGRMRPSGLAEITAAQADGRWSAAYAAQRDAPVPADLAESLTANPLAAARFGALGRTARYRLILPLLKARTPAGRARRLDRLLAGLLQDRPGEPFPDRDPHAPP